MGQSHRTLLTTLTLALLIKCTSSLKHHLVLTNDHRMYFSVSSFGYVLGGRLDVIVQNLTLWPDPSEDIRTEPQYGFVLIKTDQTKNPFMDNPGDEHRSCMLNKPQSYFSHDLITFSLIPDTGKVLVRCTGDKNFPSIRSLPHNSREVHERSHSSYIHVRNKRAALNDSSTDTPKSSLNHLVMKSDDLIDQPETKSRDTTSLHLCPGVEDLSLIIHTDEMGRRSYAFNFSMLIRKESEEGFYYLTFNNCKGRSKLAYNRPHRDGVFTPTSFNLSMLIHETNYPENYLSAGAMPLPQMYFVLSVMFFLIGCIWVNFIARQKESAFKIHYLMTVLVFAKSCSLLFHGINYHYIALDGQPVVTWAYIYYATRSLKGALFFITLALIGSGWSFIKHILSEKDKKIILVIVGLQIIAHIAEIVLDESTEGEASNEFWSDLCSLVDLFSCVVILYPITWSVRHLEEASKTDGKAAINLKKLELFKRFYIMSTIYIYITRILAFIFLSMLSYRYAWLAELVSEFATLVYFVVTGYYFQPMPTNPYLLLSNDVNELEEDILFSRDACEMNHSRIDGSSDEIKDSDHDNLLKDGERRIVRRNIEEVV